MKDEFEYVFRDYGQLQMILLIWDERLSGQARIKLVGVVI
jgi:hypothetical protein